jgi:hypothetical protein
MRRIFLAVCLAVCAYAADSALTGGARAVWDVAKAHREATPTRERISINGLWRWQPASGAAQAPPGGSWGYLHVPESWTGGGQRSTGALVFYPHPDWKSQRASSVNTAWYEREITIPREWAGRRIVLSAEYVYSLAAVYVDGVKAGEMRYPAGEVDLSRACRPGRTHKLSVRVAALPLRAVMLSHNDTATAKEVEGRVARRGLCGDVYLEAMPAGPRLREVRIETSVRRWEIRFEVEPEALEAKARYTLRARVREGRKQIEEFASRPFTAADLAGGRIALTSPWRPPKLWDTHTPGNQYEAGVSLVDGAGKVLDTAFDARFGFRELWIEGRDIILNGTRIQLTSVPLDSGLGSALEASYEGTRGTLQRFKSFGVNFVFTHNYGCEPGAHLSYEEVLRAADDEGLLLALSQPHFSNYDWTAADAERTNGYAEHARFYARVAGNHPSVVFYSTSHNATGYSEDMNPDMTDGIQNPRDQWALRNAARALRAEAVIRKMDGSRIVYHHASGNLGPMHTSNFYANWTPIQEMSDWFEHWATMGVKPVFLCEYGVPFMWDWGMYRGWYKGKREFGSAVAPWEFTAAEWNAQFFGDAAYRINDAEKANIRWEAAQYKKGREGWYRWDYPYHLNTDAIEDRFRVLAMYYTANRRAQRTWGISGDVSWDHDGMWKRKPQGAEAPLEVDWDRLQKPGPRPVYLREDEARARMAFHPENYEPTVAAEAVIRNNQPVLAYIAGKPAAFTSQDHNFTPVETVEKQIIVLNNSRVAVEGEGAWSFRGETGTAKISVAAGGQQRIPLRFKLPDGAAAGRHELRAKVKLAGGETQEDTLAIDVMAPSAGVRTEGRIALFDPKGETAKLLAGLNVEFRRVDAAADLAGYDTLIVGKGALTVDGAAPGMARVRDGLKVIVFEQTAEVLERRLGFRVAEYGMRWVFRRVPDHLLAAGLSEETLRDWRGAATILPPRLTYERPALFNYVPTVMWAGIPVTRVWRAGNRGSVASVLIEKPARGDFLAVFDAGYAMQYSPLLEYREGQGLVLLCQLDVTGRTEPDPAAKTLAANILRYVAAWRPGARRRVVYAGETAGKEYLRAAGFAPGESGRLPAAGVLVVGPGGGEQLAPRRAEVGAWLSAGGRVLAFGLDEAGANAFLPHAVGMTAREHIAAYFAAFAGGSPLAGVSPADVHNRDPRTIPLVTSGAAAAGDGVLASAEDGRVVFCQMAPWQLDYSGGRMNVKRTFRRAACAAARLLANLGAESATPLVERFSKPAGAGEKRWLEGFYLDLPEEWDDPYRFFRW